MNHKHQEFSHKYSENFDEETSKLVYRAKKILKEIEILQDLNDSEDSSSEDDSFDSCDAPPQAHKTKPQNHSNKLFQIQIYKNRILELQKYEVRSPGILNPYRRED